MNQPEIKDALELLRRYKTQKSWSNATLATSMTTLGWTWSEVFIAALFRGTMKPSEEQCEYIKRYILSGYYDETSR